MPFRAKGLATVLQIENKEDEYNPYAHSPQDNIAHMNLAYWEEQIKATVASAAHLAVPVAYGFTLTATPPSRTIAPGGVATFTVDVQPTGGFAAPVDLVAVSPSPSLTLDLYPRVVHPPGQATLILTHTGTATLLPGQRYTVPITATGGGIMQTTSVSLLMEGGETVGFTLTAMPSSRTIAPGGVATFTIEVQPVGGFTAPVDLVAASASPSLALDLYPRTVDPPGQATLTLTDARTATLLPGRRYTVPITATGGGITQTTSVSVFLGGGRVYLPIVLRERLFAEGGRLGARVQDYGPGAIPFSHFRDCVPQKGLANWALWGFLLRRPLVLVSEWGQILHMRFPTYGQDECLYDQLSAAERR